MVAGEITTSAYVDFQEVVRATINEIGYNRGKFGFDGETCAVLSSIHSQSPDIAMGVDTGGAGDQGMMFGFACSETARKSSTGSARTKHRPCRSRPACSQWPLVVK